MSDGSPRSGRRKVREGSVVSAKMDKTVVVAVQRLIRHPVYGRVVKRTSSLRAHDEKNECDPGDFVRVMETRPLSKTKRWRVVEIVSKAKRALDEEQQDDSGIERSDCS